MRILITVLFSLFLGKLDAQVLAGPYAPPAGQNNSTAIHKDSTILVGWATSSTLTRGNQDISNPSLGVTTIGTSNSATDKSGTNGVVSLGDGGSAILTFDGKITNGPGADFAVFENSFDNLFLELAFVEVSSDGIIFYRFDAVSLTDTDIQTETFGNTDATNLYNLAGKYRGQYGTPFDLDELNGISGLDINQVTHIKIVDVVGNISNSSYSTSDSQGNTINDPWPTPFPSSGFDLDAIGVINFIPTSIEDFNKTLTIGLYPNPVKNIIHFDTQVEYHYSLSNINGYTIKNGLLRNELDVSDLKTGVYFIHIFSDKKSIVKKIIKK